MVERHTPDEPTQGRRRIFGFGVIHLDALWDVLRRKREFAAFPLILTLVLAIIYLHSAHRVFGVSMQIMPASQSTHTDDNSRLSALSSIAGINLGGGDDAQFRIFLDSLQSPVAADALIKRQDLLKRMFPEEWSEGEHTWRPPESQLRPAVQFIERLLGFNVVVWSPPSRGRLFDYLQQNLRIVQNQKSRVVTLEMDIEDPSVATDILLALNSSVDNFMRQQALEHTSRYIDYLAKKLETVTEADYRQALTENLAGQEKTRMMASSPLPFVSDVLGPPMTSRIPVSPSPVAVFAAALVAGILLGATLAIFADRRGWNIISISKRLRSSDRSTLRDERNAPR